MNSAHRPVMSTPPTITEPPSLRLVATGIADRSSTDQHPLEVVQQIAQYFSVLSEPMRLRILDLLRDGEKCVQDLVGAMDTSQANVSKHLKVMLQAGILDRRTEGTSAYYRVADELIFDLCGLVCDRIAERIELQAQQFREFSLASRQ
jgi:DNA-binding transcriptional ArsR family regulator